MATDVPTGPGTRHEKESLNDYVARIDPAEVPVYTNCSKKSVGAIKHEWTVQELGNPNSDNFQNYGADSSDTAGLFPTRLDNVVAESTKDGKVADIYNGVDTARGQEREEQQILKGLELRRDLEAMITANRIKTTGSPPKFAGFQNYITNVSLGATGTAPAGTGADLVVPGTLRALNTIDYIDTANEAAYTEGGNPRVMYMSPGLTRKFSKIPDASAGTNAASNNQINQTNTQPLTFVGAASMYLSDFGLLQCTPSRHMASQVILGIDPDHASIGILPGGDFAIDEIAKVGTSERFVIAWRGTVEMDAPKAHWAVHALNLS